PARRGLRRGRRAQDIAGKDRTEPRVGLEENDAAGANNSCFHLREIQSDDRNPERIVLGWAELVESPVEPASVVPDAELAIVVKIPCGNEVPNIVQPERVQKPPAGHGVAGLGDGETLE